MGEMQLLQEQYVCHSHIPQKKLDMTIISDCQDANL